jgi:hypothetical protein
MSWLKSHLKITKKTFQQVGSIAAVALPIIGSIVPGVGTLAGAALGAALKGATSIGAALSKATPLVNQIATAVNTIGGQIKGASQVGSTLGNEAAKTAQAALSAATPPGPNLLLAWIKSNPVIAAGVGLLGLALLTGRLGGARHSTGTARRRTSRKTHRKAAAKRTKSGKKHLSKSEFLARMAAGRRKAAAKRGGKKAQRKRRK